MPLSDSLEELGILRGSTDLTVLQAVSVRGQKMSEVWMYYEILSKSR